MNSEGPWAILGEVLKVLGKADLGIGVGMRKRKAWVLGGPAQPGQT